MLLRWDVVITISHALWVKTFLSMKIYWRYIYYFFFAAPVVFYWFTSWTLDSHWSIVLAPVCFSKLLKGYLRAAEKWRNCCAALKYVLPVQETQWSSEPSKLVLECINNELKETCKIYNFSNNFALASGKDNIAHKRTILKLTRTVQILS
jgi:hypothetical protein